MISCKPWFIKINLSFNRVPVFEERIDNIVGIAYAKDMLEYIQKVPGFLNSRFSIYIHYI